ncbi:hypothetical protein D9615_004180, partial [Tricholomella constricta]
MHIFSLIPLLALCSVVSVGRHRCKELSTGGLQHSIFARREKRGHVKRTFFPVLQNLQRPLELTIFPGKAQSIPLLGVPSNILQLLRQNVTEGQIGVSLTLDIGVLDVTTCKPLPNVMVEVWSTNALGKYGSTFLRGATT